MKMRVNVEETKKYYNSIKQEELCDCNYCKNYYLQIKAQYPEVSVYLDSLGVDIEKPFETSPLEPDENNILEYCCVQYLVFGSCPDNYNYKIGEVKVGISKSYPTPNIEIKSEYFVLDFYPIKLKMIQ